MNCCKSNQCRGIEDTFNDKMARSDLEKYQRKGPGKQTRMLLAAVLKEGVSGASLLDVGGGAGAIQHELVRGGVEKVVNVDASPAYSHTAREEAARLGYAERAEYRVGDFVEIAAGLDPVDIVTMDRVICCYDDMPALVSAAVGKARRVIGVVYPVDRWSVHLGMAAFNAVQSVLRKSFRVFVHPEAEVDAIIRSVGFEKQFQQKGFFWQVAVYSR